MVDAHVAKPQSDINAVNALFFEGLRRNALLIQRCGACGRLRHYPRPMCPECLSTDVEWIEVSRVGVVHSWTVTHHCYHRAFESELPLTLALVDLPEGVRVLVPVRGACQIAIGDEVTLEFDASMDPDGSNPLCRLHAAPRPGGS